jgi:DNA transformation protein and related proteins
LSTSAKNFPARPIPALLNAISSRPNVMLGMVRDNTLYFRVDDHNRVTFKEAESFPSLNYEKKGSTIDLSFWHVPDPLFDEPDGLVSWAQAALAAARRVAAKRERTAPRRKSKLHPP